MNIEQRKTADLIPYARNAKLHNEQQIAQIAASIKEFGFNDPIEITVDNVIIAGHGRVLAAQKLGLTEVPVIVHSHLTDNQRKAYTLLNNRLAETGGGWDTEMLKLELDELPEFTFDCFEGGFDLIKEYDYENSETVPSLDELAEEYGNEPLEDSFYPILRFKVTPEAKSLFESLMKQASGNNEYEKFDIVVNAIDKDKVK
jgi:hypothetical protein